MTGAEGIAPQLAARVAAGQIRLGIELFGLDEIGVALRRLRDGRLAGRAVLTPVVSDD